MRTPRISKKELLSMACKFVVGPHPIIDGKFGWWEKYPNDLKRYAVYVERTGPITQNGPNYWTIFVRPEYSQCLNKQMKIEDQPLPSNRDRKFFARCRFSSVHKAIAHYRQWFAACEVYWMQKVAVQGQEAEISYLEVAKAYQTGGENDAETR